MSSEQEPTCSEDQDNDQRTMPSPRLPKPAQQPMSAWLFSIGVDDIDRATTAVTDGGGTLIHDSMEIPGGEFSLAAIDPQGAAFGLVGPRLAKGA